jgi:hypothetical protein
VFETRRFTLEEFKQIRNLVSGSTINDAVLAVCGGALRRYLLTHDELPGPSMVSIAPLSIRNADQNTTGRAGLSMMRVPLGTEIEDPVRRLRSIHQHTSNAADIGQAVGAKELTDITKHAPATTLACRRGCWRTGNRRRAAAPIATAITLCQGAVVVSTARMTYFSAIMPISGRRNVRGNELRRRIVIADLVPPSDPDPGTLLCIRESFRHEPRTAASETEPQGSGQKKRKGQRRRSVGPAAPPRRRDRSLGLADAQAACIRPAARSYSEPTSPDGWKGFQAPSFCDRRSARIHITAGLKPSPQWLPGTQMFS